MTNLEFQEVGLVFPDLTAQDIDVRVERIVENNNGAGLTLLLYKDARVDMRMLDEVVGALNWQREHTIIDGVNFCTVSIRSCHDWVRKMDAGKAGQFEKEKGAASDAFKRACTNCGIGRELYTCPEIFIWQSHNSQDGFFNLDHKDGKPITRDKFECAKIIIEDKTIKAVAIRNVSTGKLWSIDTRS